jgi:hypothetical protein
VKAAFDAGAEDYVQKAQWWQLVCALRRAKGE